MQSRWITFFLGWMLTVGATGSPAQAADPRLVRNIHVGDEAANELVTGSLDADTSVIAVEVDDTLDLWLTDGSPGGTRVLSRSAFGPRGCPAPPISCSTEPPPMVAGDQRGALIGTIRRTGLVTLDATRSLQVLSDSARILSAPGWAKDLGRAIAPVARRLPGQNDGPVEIWSVDPANHAFEVLGDPIAPPGWSVKIVPRPDGAIIWLIDPTGNGADELWVTDGTSAGTQKIRDGVFRLADDALDGRWAVGFHRDELGNELWITDGTVGGTRRVSDIAPGAGGTFLHAGPERVDVATPVGDRMVVVASGGPSGPGLYAVDPAAPQAVRIADLGSGPSPISTGWSRAMIPLEGRVLFEAETADAGFELWSTDGTAAGTQRVVDLCPGPCSSELDLDRGWAFASEQRLIVMADDGVSGTEPWAVDIETGDAELLVDMCPGPCGMADVRLAGDGRRALLYAPGFGLWTTDGTASGTEPVGVGLQDVRLGGATPAAGGLVFPAAGPPDGLGPWVSDGTAGGTHRLASVTDDEAGSDPHALTAWGDRLFFFADDGLSGHEPWTSDGTEDGTVARADVQPGPQGAGAAFAHSSVTVGERVVFLAATDPQHVFQMWSVAADGSAPVQLTFSPGGVDNGFFGRRGDLVLFHVRSGFGITQNGLWRTDGTPAGTFRLLGDFSGPPRVYVEAGERTLFVAAIEDGWEIWSTDGTVDGTRRALDLRGYDGLFRPVLSAAFDDLAAIGARDGSFEDEVWLSDGTAAGTRRIWDRTERLAMEPSSTTASHLFFVTHQDFTDRLWAVDRDGVPTVVATAGLFEMVLWELGPRPPGALFYFATSESGVADRLWASDGTVAGTRVVGTFAPRSISRSPAELFGERLLFGVGGDDLFPRETWVSDGTVAGTRRLINGAHAEIGADRSSTIVDGQLAFGAWEAGNRCALWSSDGTSDGTFRVGHVEPSFSFGCLEHITQVGDQVFFSAWRSDTNRELFSVPASDVGLPTLALRPDDRFRIQVRWQKPDGETGFGTPLRLTSDTGLFWFFRESNLELMVKILDGRANNGHFWVFYGALSNVAYEITVTDTQSGASKVYTNPSGAFASVGDTRAFAVPGGASSAVSHRSQLAEAVDALAAMTAGGRAAAPIESRSNPIPPGCATTDDALCLQQSRFTVSATWEKPDGETGSGTAVALSSDTGTFWFFRDTNVEVMVKVLDGRDNNGHFWVFYGALSNVKYTLTVTDTLTGAVRTYENPPGQFASVGDTQAFAVP